MPTSEEKNQTYITGIREGDSKIIRSIYENYHKAIVKLVETNQGTKDDAHDVFQEALVLMFQKVQAPNFKLTSSFLTYFYAISRNIWYNKLRKKSNSEVTLDNKMLLMVEQDTTSIGESNEQYFLYRKMFLQLGQDCQKLLDLFLQKVRMEQIMQKMGFGSVSYTKKRKFLCKEKLVKLIQNDPSFQELKAGGK